MEAVLGLDPGLNSIDQTCRCLLLSLREVDANVIMPGELVGAIMRINHILESRLDRALNGCGLSFAQYEVFEILIEEPNLHPGELGRRLDITRQSAHGLLHQLARAGLVDLLPKDGGLRCAWVTPDGTRRLRHCRQALRGVGHALTKLPSGTGRELIDALSAVDALLASKPMPWWLD